MFATAEKTQAQQSVAVVYDDSGSMLGEGKWWYANYAMQSMIGLLSPQDELIVVRMSDPAVTTRIDLRDRRASIAKEHQQPEPDGGTPYQAVQTAMKALKSARHKDRWLLVITDGNVEDTIPEDQLRQEAQALVRDTGVRVRLLLIEKSRSKVAEQLSKAEVRVWEEEAQAEVYVALSVEEIISELRKVAADISGYALGQGPKITIQNDILEIETDFPLQKIILFEQTPEPSGTVAEVRQASSGTTSLRVEETLDLTMPSQATVSLTGRLTLLSPDTTRGVIPPGTVRIALSRSPDPSRLLVIPHVAARLDVVLHDSNGTPLPMDNTTLQPCLDELLTLQATLITPQGDTLMMPASGQIQVEAFLNSQSYPMQLATPPTWFEHSFRVGSTPQTLSVRAHAPGYFNFRSRLYTLEGTFCKPPRVLDIQPREPWDADVAHMETHPPLEILPTADGQPLDAQDFSTWTLDILDDGGHRLEPSTENTSWHLRPLPRWGLPWLTPADTFSVRVRVASNRRGEVPVEKTLRFVLRRDLYWPLWVYFLIALGVFLFLMWYILGIRRKPRFARDASITWEEDRNQKWRKVLWQPLPTSFFSRWMVPYLPEKRVIDSYRFVAASGKKIKVQGSNLPVGTSIGLETVEEPPEPFYFMYENETLHIKQGQQTRFTYSLGQEAL